MPKLIHPILIDHILPFYWDVQRVWALEAPIQQIPCSEFVYLLALPLWSSVKGHGMLFDTCPIDVIRDPGLSAYQTERLNRVNLDYPVDVLLMDGRRWILDGVHRITKHIMLDNPTLPVRFHSERAISAIRQN